MTEFPPVSTATKYQLLLDDLGGTRSARRALMGEDVRVERIWTDGNAFVSVEVLIPPLLDVGQKGSPNWPFIKDHNLKPRRFYAGAPLEPPKVKCPRCKGTGWHARQDRRRPPPGNCAHCERSGMVSPLDELEDALDREAASHLPVCGLTPIQRIIGVGRVNLWTTRSNEGQADPDVPITSRELAHRLYRAGFATRLTDDVGARLEQRIPCPDCVPGTRCTRCYEAGREGWISREYRLFRLEGWLPEGTTEENLQASFPNRQHLAVGTRDAAVGDWLFLLRIGQQPPPKARGRATDSLRNPHWPLITIFLPIRNQVESRLSVRRAGIRQQAT